MDARNYSGVYYEESGTGLSHSVYRTGYEKIVMEQDIKYMKMALEEAKMAADQGEIPVGAVVVCQNRVIARTHNLTEMLTDVTAHAEMQAITAAASTLGGKYLSQCTLSKDHVKVVTRHIWEPYMEICEDIRHTVGMKDLYSQRKETIERIFGTAKENHGFRYTQMFGKVRMEMKVGLTFACMNLKKLAKMKAKWGYREERKTGNSSVLDAIRIIKEKWHWCTCTSAALSTV